MDALICRHLSGFQWIMLIVALQMLTLVTLGLQTPGDNSSVTWNSVGVAADMLSAAIECQGL